MLGLLAIGWFLSVALLLAYGWLVSYELHRGTRVGYTHVRSRLEQPLAALESTLIQVWSHFVRYEVQLHWHYGIHALYRSTLLTLQGVYSVVEEKFEQNRARTKRLRAERRRASQNPATTGHLHAVAAHKEASALTPAQKRALKKKSLEA